MSFDRRDKILTLLRDKGVVKLKELEELFPQVSSTDPASGSRVL